MKRFTTYFALAILISVLSFIGISSKSKIVDHTDMVTGPFNNAQEVTAACIECHSQQASDFMKTRHWNWEGDSINYKGKNIKFGKKHSINNMLISISSNEPLCTSCHPGFGWVDNNFDFSKAENIDCLVCHDQTGTYKRETVFDSKNPKKIDLLNAARNVGKPTKQNCGTCHFSGNGLNHAEMDPSVLSVDAKLDVHMNEKGMECIDCHKAESHNIKGANHGSMISNTNHISCTNCHDPNTKIHKNALLNKHINNIACETCHIPTYARILPTKTYWDWSTAGQKDDQADSEGNLIYSKSFGSFKWEKNVAPIYRWHNGGADYYFAGDKIDASGTVALNTLRGSISDKESKIAPFKIMSGKQIYDKKNNYLIIPKLFGDEGYLKSFDWNKASANGMKSVGLDYSGEYDFVSTQMLIPINHMIAKSDEALKCNDCHSSGKRLDWNALGYPADPMKKGGRAKNNLIK